MCIQELSTCKQYRLPIKILNLNNRYMWPDFQEADLEAAVAEFHTRQRRFGGLSAEPLSRELA